MTNQQLTYSRAQTFFKRPRSVTSSEVRYRADIDGLRALAVIPVVLFHAGLPWITGGFVGVDVFFVISGFLITSILAREITEKKYSIVNFYRRRALRIFPALTAMALAVFIVAYFILTPAEYVELAKSGLAVAVFGSNFYFWKSISYFQSAHAFQPLLHTWSLAIEEQYYLFFPILLRLVSFRRKMIVASLWLVLLTSLALAVLLVPTKPSMAFYLLPTRAWELMLGGLVAIGGLPKASNARSASIGSALGIVLILCAVITYTRDTPFPGLSALPPTIGTALVIWSGGRGIVATLLSHPVAVSVGRASYSIYLWHLPLLAFGLYLTAGHMSLEVALLLCAASVVMGFASLAFIEQPFRRGGRYRDQMAIAAMLGMVGIACVSALIIKAHGFPRRLGEMDTKIVATVEDKYKHHAECMTVDQSVVAPESACRLGTPKVNPTILLWGDSHAMITATALEQAALRHNAAFSFAADADCPPGIGFEIDPRFDSKLTSQLSYRYCSQYNERMLKVALMSANIRTIVLSSRWTNWRIGEPANPDEEDADVRLRDSAGTARSTLQNKAKWERGFVSLIDRLTSAGKHVVIVGPVPEPTFDVPHELYLERFGLIEATHPITRADYLRRHRAILEFFASLANKPRLSFIWPYSALCVDDECPLVDRGNVMFFDQDHLSIYAARKTSPLYDQLFSY